MSIELQARAANSAAVKQRAEIEMRAMGITPELITDLVQTFYRRVLTHPTLGPVFDAKLSQHWSEHIERMISFWTSVVFKSGAYGGKPVQAHLGIENMTPELFPQWLDLFAATLDEISPNAEVKAWFMTTAGRIAQSLSLSLFYHPSLDDPMRSRP